MGVLRALVESGRLDPDSLATMLLRKTDWHHEEAIRWLLAQGVDPNRTTQWGKTALHNAIISDNSLAIVEVLLEHGADPALRGDSGHGSRGPDLSSVSIAARRGRADVLDVFERRGIALDLDGVERLIAACARGDADGIRAITAELPGLLGELIAEGGTLLSEFAGNGNTVGVRHLLDLGVAVDAPYARGDGYFEIAANSTALPRRVVAGPARHRETAHRPRSSDRCPRRHGPDSAPPRGQGVRRLALVVLA